MWVIEKVNGRDAFGQDVDDPNCNNLPVQPVLLVEGAIPATGTVISVLLLKNIRELSSNSFTSITVDSARDLITNQYYLGFTIEYERDKRYIGIKPE